MRAGAWMLLVALAACSSGGQGPDGERSEGGDPAQVDPVTVVEVAAVERGSVSDLLISSGVVESEAQADLYPIATGTVVSIHKDEGDAVVKGELLAVIDNVSLEAGAERARSELERLAADYERLKTLFGQGAVSQREVTEAEYALKAARSSAREARASRGQTRITAPFDGVVAVRDVRIGELASSSRPAFQVVDLTALRVVASLPERDVSRVAVGQPARLVSAYDAEVFTTGEVTRIAPVVDASSGTFRVTVQLDTEQGALRPGQFVSVELEVDRHDDVLVVAKKALVYEDGEPLVYRMIPEPEDDEEDDASGDDDDEDAESGGLFAKWFGGDADSDSDSDSDSGEEPLEKFVAERAPIELGLVDQDRAEVTGGIAIGDQIVVIGQSNLRDGAAVRTPEMQAEARKRAEQAKRDKTASEEPGEDG